MAFGPLAQNLAIKIAIKIALNLALFLAKSARLGHNHARQPSKKTETRILDIEQSPEGPYLSLTGSKSNQSGAIPPHEIAFCADFSRWSIPNSYPPSAPTIAWPT